jgi:hypothetical protein
MHSIEGDPIGTSEVKRKERKHKMEINNISRRNEVTHLDCLGRDDKTEIKTIWLTIEHADYKAEVWELVDSECGKMFVLWCTDYVANSWEEMFDSLPVAIARLASLVKCNESGDGFKYEPQEFSDKVSEIL